MHDTGKFNKALRDMVINDVRCGASMIWLPEALYASQPHACCFSLASPTLHSLLPCRVLQGGAGD